MDKLIQYLNSLSVEEQVLFSLECSTTVGYLRKACSMKQILGAKICVAIESASNGLVTRKDLHPSDWHLTWPELVADQEQLA